MTSYLLDGDPAASLPALSPFGDGVFETLLICRGHAHRAARHAARMAVGAERLGLAFDPTRFHQDIAALIEQGDLRSGCYRLRYTLGRELTESGYSVEGADARRALSLRACSLPDHTQLNLNVSDVCLPDDPLLAGLKHCNRLPQILARQRIASSDYDESVMLDGQGNAVEAIAANLFLLEGNRLYTPPLDRSGVAGVMREFVIEELASQVGLAVHTEALPLQRLFEADALFLTNAISGVRQVWQLTDSRLEKEQHWPEHATVRELQAAVIHSVERQGGQ